MSALKHPKVFGLGFQKTGTTTLETMLTRLGYRVAGYNQFRDFAQRQDLTLADLEERALALLPEYDAAKDTPWPVLYRQLDAACPGAKFIHITRDTETWIASVVKDFAQHPNALHRVIYGVPFPVGHEEVFCARYEAHNAEVAAYFADRPEDYLHMRLNELSYERICPFLGRPVLDRGTPKSNTRFRKRMKRVWWRLTGGV
ncbi:MAG: sulfotransferase family protein [Pseudomonadota bacterium]